ncbi:hypothetical protein BZA05DRAFT_397335 [Tricharina praecox]|uniref:uncharacterized protein n=1 Tax=Tricharina praecox TaxID=43433 RepID=UPI00221F7FE8|nr:uncharacterized protein BZA05DRAFT_397335 [Tricharina praecox]KAI5852254.1 hypothetical protein BZA05DRAFT_397335 [Tricharina praecox]
MSSEPPPTAAVCTRCKENPGIYTLRLDPHCSDCFSHYIRSKCIKRIESYKIRSLPNGSIPVFLLPLSLGVSSTALLQILSTALTTQRQKVSRARYTLKIVHIDESLLNARAPPAADLAAIRERFPEAGEYSVVKLEEIYSFEGEGSGEGSGEGDGEDNAARLRQTLQSLPSPTSREDLARVLRTRLIQRLAAQHGCAGILWGSSTTTLASQILTSSALGRGASLPFLTQDGVHEGVLSYHPLRDVFKKELVTFVKDVVQPSLWGLCTAEEGRQRHSAANAISARNITVGELLTQYFETMEVQYPSTVSNVVRMGDRLKTVGEERRCCTLCGLSVDGGGNGLTLGAEENGDEVPREMCYGCLRSTHGATVELSWPVL